jgi:hypothetical protein
MKRPSDSVADDKTKRPAAIYDRISVQNVMAMVFARDPAGEATINLGDDDFVFGHEGIREAFSTDGRNNVRTFESCIQGVAAPPSGKADRAGRFVVGVGHGPQIMGLKLWCLPPLRRRELAGGLFDDVGGLEQGFFFKRLADELQAERQALRVEAGGDGDAGETGHVDRHREDVVEVHLYRI